MKDSQRQRYARHLVLPELGEAGQQALLCARMLVVGTGGLGSPAALYLAAAGVGTLVLMDGDRVELSNLQRQILHTTAALGRSKVASAADTLAALNPEIDVRAVPEHFTASHADLLDDVDFVIDATDNFASKFLIADLCHARSTPYCHAGIRGWHGQAMTVLPGETACVRCLCTDAPPPAASDAAPAGPVGALPGVIGSIQALEAIKAIAGCGTLLVNRLLSFDTLPMRFREIPVPRAADCPLCG